MNCHLIHLLCRILIIVLEVDHKPMVRFEQMISFDSLRTFSLFTGFAGANRRPNLVCTIPYIVEFQEMMLIDVRFKLRQTYSPLQL